MTDFVVMAESFGNSFTFVEVTPDDGSAKQLWIAFAKPSQAVTLVLAEVPEGWTAATLLGLITDDQQDTFGKLELMPGDVYRLNPKY
ncbi:hypothetical protein NLM27_41905 [Bradyrhizobium sp. CCGB12]|uniref:hypothetical protein n=1 Tax=Bradyrhizobium sp. CCGB12 TaxID=2949632 RepID=UPI0020B3FDC9|nr:hypothetical protein [Bradyrhizobium sp. CCGB12]MCP3395290.1 hypothetical protein [Bradyrhizobium sp. CCGB12]